MAVSRLSIGKFLELVSNLLTKENYFWLMVESNSGIGKYLKC